jgi:hypothetical protein
MVKLPSTATGRCALTCDNERNSAPKSPKSGQSLRTAGGAATSNIRLSACGLTGLLARCFLSPFWHGSRPSEKPDRDTRRCDLRVTSRGRSGASMLGGIR